MIDLSDMTLRSTDGNYKLTCQVMEAEMPRDKWMLRTRAIVTCEDGMSYFFMLHFYKNGEVWLMETNRPIAFEIPEDDIRELYQWIIFNGWDKLIIHRDFLQDKMGFEFWLRLYRTGMVYNRELEKRDEEEMKRMDLVIKEDLEE